MKWAELHPGVAGYTHAADGCAPTSTHRREVLTFRSTAWPLRAPERELRRASQPWYPLKSRRGRAEILFSARSKWPFMRSVGNGDPWCRPAPFCLSRTSIALQHGIHLYRVLSVRTLRLLALPLSCDRSPARREGGPISKDQAIMGWQLQGGNRSYRVPEA
jgi:hypothetical protein